jgi:hypothetical protein
MMRSWSSRLGVRSIPPIEGRAIRIGVSGSIRSRQSDLSREVSPMCRTAMVLLAALLSTGAYAEPAPSAGMVTALPWKFKGVVAHKVAQEKRARIFITAHGDVRRQLATATLVAKRIAAGKSLDYVNVHVSDNESGCPTRSWIMHGATAQGECVIRGKRWILRSAVPSAETAIDPSDIIQPAGFSDPVAQYDRVCPEMVRCFFGLSGC